MEQLVNEQIPPDSLALVAMSGGVDSSVVAAMLLEQGIRCIGVTMQHKPTGQEQDIADAKAVCTHLGIPHITVSIQEEYEIFLEEEIRKVYGQGRTPNPCVLCNERMKFGLFFDKFISLAEEQQIIPDTDRDRPIFYASGHYARVVKLDSGYYSVARAPYAQKDQSYFLYRLTQNQLQRLRFPLGEMEKPQVRLLAEKYGLIVKKKPDSQDFCMHPSVLRPAKEKPTVLVNQSGDILGAGLGISHYTIGMRRGLGVSSTTPLYVTELRPETGEVVLGEESELYRSAFTVDQIVYVPELLDYANRVSVRIRSMSTAQPATVSLSDDGKLMYIVTKQPQRAVTPGQSAVLYYGEVVLGGGFIC
ncbi:tRNA 2-thiouridine(34) synthase MnmA [Entomospira entomophila]|uniref:tRNA-uridine 2-sulfurtransferase n=2 Tax=Entomospira entomophila TaxID=2719988 RepID=A0A968KRZ3_9SPIO|nr:tRNA 2-thiouridine(34) synthase MnmA [Entomospira entomophilus]NIZ41219.1 tRNA 2-thiouridine(34) synthase MnmA [Entomospira entomophilus]WDI35425.1 tRNA 2-thiouridine(34) synthase MnmA [Entomospira entomophilus]